jgi:hypothetical protein
MLGEFADATPSLLNGSTGAQTALIAQCESNGIHWLQWGFDDNDADPNVWYVNGAFQDLLNNGVYSTPAQLGATGIPPALNPRMGWYVLASPAAVFI